MVSGISADIVRVLLNEKYVDEAVASTAAMQRLQTAHKYQVQAMNAFMKAARPLVADEEAYLELEHDLVSVNPQPEDSVPSFVAAIFMATGLGRLIRSSVGDLDIPSRVHRSKKASETDQILQGSEPYLGAPQGFPSKPNTR